MRLAKDGRTVAGLLLILSAGGCRPAPTPPYPTWAEAVAAPVPDSSNAFAAYIEAGQTAEAAAGDLLDRVHFTPKYRRDALRALAAPLARLEASISKPCRFEYQPRPPFHAPKYHAGWRLLGLCMLWKVQDAVAAEQWADAAREATRLVKFGFDLTGGGAIEASLGLSLVDEARQALAPSLEGMDPETLNELSLGLGRVLDGRPTLATMIEHEHAQMMQAVQYVQDAYRSRDYAELGSRLGSDVNNAVDYLKEMEKDDRKTRPAYFEGFAAEADAHRSWLVRQTQAPASERAALGPQKLAEPRPWKRFAKQFFLAADPLIGLDDRTIARTRLLILEAQLLRAVKTNGSAPASLEGFRKELATDPFTGRPFVYRADGALFQIYSVGADFQDDGGDTDESFTTPDLRLER